MCACACVCVVPQGCDPACTDSSASTGSHLAVWSSSPPVCGDSLCLHRSQRLPGKAHHIYVISAVYMYSMLELYSMLSGPHCQFDSTLKTVCEHTVLVVKV